MMDLYSWFDLAACRDEDPELFFPEGSSNRAYAQAAEAKQVCARCPVVDRCYGFAASNPYVVYGIWAGLDASTIRKASRHVPGARRSA